MGLYSAVEIIHECVVKPEDRGLFELTYGPGGAWSNLFSRSPGFHGITVLRDAHNPQRFLIIELWDNEEERARTLDAHAGAYAELQTDLSRWVASSTQLGVFGILTEATVRPPRYSQRDG